MKGRTYHHKEGDDDFVIPRTDNTTSLQRKKEGCYGCEGEKTSDPIQRGPFLQGGLSFVSRVEEWWGCWEEYRNGGERLQNG